MQAVFLERYLHLLESEGFSLISEIESIRAYRKDATFVFAGIYDGYFAIEFTISTPPLPTPTPTPEQPPQANQITVSQNRSPVLSGRAVSFNPISYEAGNLRYTLIGADYSHIDGRGGVNLNTAESIALSFADGFQRTIFYNRDIIGTRDHKVRLYFMVEPTSAVSSARDMPSANLTISARDNRGSAVGTYYNSLTNGSPTFEIPLYGAVFFAIYSDSEWIDIDLGGVKYRLMLNIMPYID